MTEADCHGLNQRSEKPRGEPPITADATALLDRFAAEADPIVMTDQEQLVGFLRAQLPGVDLKHVGAAVALLACQLGCERVVREHECYPDITVDEAVLYFKQAGLHLWRNAGG